MEDNASPRYHRLSNKKKSQGKVGMLNFEFHRSFSLKPFQAWQGC